MIVSSPLENLAKTGKQLTSEPPDENEFAGLTAGASRRLKDARNPANSLESRFDLAYGAAHSMCLAALRHNGYRPSNRFIVFQVLPHTLQLGPEVWRVLAKCHDLRNLSEYEGSLNVNERLVSDLIAACETVAEKLAALPPINPDPSATSSSWHP